jgi:hypothetical protein
MAKFRVLFHNTCGDLVLLRLGALIVAVSHDWLWYVDKDDYVFIVSMGFLFIGWEKRYDLHR